MSIGSHRGVILVSYQRHLIGKVLVVTESLCSSGCSQPERDEVNALMIGSEGFGDSLLGGGEVSESLGGGSVASNVGGDPPILEDPGSLEEGAEFGLGGMHEVSEPLGQRLLGVRVIVHWGSVDGGIEGEGVDWVLRSSHRALCCSLVRGANSDVPGLGLESRMRYGKMRESSPICDKTQGSRGSRIDRGSGGLISEPGDFSSKALDEAGVGSGSGSAEFILVVLDFLDMGLGASSKRACSDFSQSAKDLCGGARGLFVKVLDDGEGRGR
jgi:hypothetical protein